MSERDNHCGSTAILVAGEPADLLLAIFRSATFSPAREGLVRVDALMTRPEGACLLRALMRIEAELLLHDADRLTAEAPQSRTHTQRRADAFVALALRVTDAMAG